MMRLMAAVVVLLLSSAPLAAQQEQEDAAEETNKEKLPPIVLPEFDITGKERPEPPEFTKRESSSDHEFSPMNRDPLLEERGSAGMNKGGKPELPVGKIPGSLTGKVVAGYGKFVTPSVISWIGRSGRKMDVIVSGKYSSSDGHVAFSDERKLEFDASLSWKVDFTSPILRDARVITSAEFNGDRYKFYGSQAPSVARTVDHGSIRVGTISSFQPWDLMYEMRVQWHTYTVKDVTKSRENELSVGLTGLKMYGPISAQAKADVSANFLNSPLSQYNPILISAGVEGQGRLFPSFQLKGGVVLNSLRNSDTGTQVRLYPQVEARYLAGNYVTIFAQSKPTAEKNSLRRLIGKNPYLGNTIAIRHQEIFTDFSGGMELTLSTLARGRVVVSYQRSRNYPVIVDRDRNGIWELSYVGKIRMYALTADATIQWSKNDRLSGSFRLLNSEYSVTNQRVPYWPSALLTGTYQRRLGPRFSMQASIQYVGQRYADLGATRKLNSYVRVDVKGEYNFSRSISLFLLTENLFDQNYSVWENYVARPFYIRSGLTVQW